MGLAPTWPRHLSSLIVAVTVALLALMPSIDPLMCGNDEAPAASIQAVQTISGHRDGAPAKHSQAPAECPHGHCHHAAPMMASAAYVETGQASGAERHAVEPAADRRSAPSFGLKRPPRA